MPLRDEPGKLAHLQVVDELRERLKRGDFEIGDRLPPGRQLAAQLDVALMTVQKAIRVLETEGLVSIRRGAGVKVLAIPTDPPSPKSQLEALTQQMETVKFQIRHLSSQVAELQELSARVERVEHAITRLHQQC